MLSLKEKSANSTCVQGMMVSVAASKHTDVCMLNMSGSDFDYGNIMKAPAVVSPVYCP